MENKKVKLSWTADLEEVPSIAKELYFKALTKFNHHDLLSSVDKSIEKQIIADQIESIDKLRVSLASFDARLEDIYYLLLSYQKTITDNKLNDMFSQQRNVDEEKKE